MSNDVFAVLLEHHSRNVARAEHGQRLSENLTPLAIELAFFFVEIRHDAHVRARLKSGCGLMKSFPRLPQLSCRLSVRVLFCAW